MQLIKSIILQKKSNYSTLKIVLFVYLFKYLLDLTVFFSYLYCISLFNSVYYFGFFKNVFYYLFYQDDSSQGAILNKLETYLFFSNIRFKYQYFYYITTFCISLQFIWIKMCLYLKYTISLLPSKCMTTSLYYPSWLILPTNSYHGYSSIPSICMQA